MSTTLRIDWRYRPDFNSVGLRPELKVERHLTLGQADTRLWLADEDNDIAFWLSEGQVRSLLGALRSCLPPGESEQEDVINTVGEVAEAAGTACASCHHDAEDHRRWTDGPMPTGCDRDNCQCKRFVSEDRWRDAVGLPLDG